MFNKIIDAINTDYIYELIEDVAKKTDMEVEKDYSNNIIIKKLSKVNNAKKILFCAVAEHPEIIVTKIEKNKAWFEKNFTTNKSSLCNLEVFKNKESVGIIRGDYNEEKLVDTFIDCWNDTDLSIGDFCRLKLSARCKVNTLYGYYIPSLIYYKLAIDFLCNQMNCVNDIYFTLPKGENMLTAIVDDIKPDNIFFIHCAEANDKFKSSKGCGVVYKDGCAVVDKNIRMKMIEIANNKFQYQSFIGKDTTITEKLGITGKGASVGGVYIPVDYFKTPTQSVSIADIDNAQKLINKLVNI